jgi:ribonuclease HI
MKTLYVEISLCQSTGAGGWGAALEVDGRATTFGDSLPDAGGSTVAELAAVEAAVGRLEASGKLQAGDTLEVALRSTAALSVLRWVFPEAQVRSAMEIHAPKKIAAATRALPAIYDLSDTIERLGVTVALRHVGQSDVTRAAQASARASMVSRRRA